ATRIPVCRGPDTNVRVWRTVGAQYPTAETAKVGGDLAGRGQRARTADHGDYDRKRPRRESRYGSASRRIQHARAGWLGVGRGEAARPLSVQAAAQLK